MSERAHIGRHVRVLLVDILWPILLRSAKFSVGFILAFHIRECCTFLLVITSSFPALRVNYQRLSFWLILFVVRAKNLEWVDNDKDCLIGDMNTKFCLSYSEDRAKYTFCGHCSVLIHGTLVLFLIVNTFRMKDSKSTTKNYTTHSMDPSCSRIAWLK